MADYQDAAEVQEFLTMFDNIAEQLRLLKVRVVVVKEQTVDATLLEDLCEIESFIEMKLELLPGQRNRLEQLSIVNMESFHRHSLGWRMISHDFLRIFTIDVARLEERAKELNTQEPVNDLVSAVITQQQLDNESKKTCSVCMDDFQLDESVKKCTGCQNFFHNHCMTTWLATKTNCPLCRSILRM